MRPPWLGGGSDSDDSSSDEDHDTTTSSASGAQKVTKIMADLSLDDDRLHKRVISHVEDEKAITRLLSLTKERIAQNASYEAQRKTAIVDFEKTDAAIAEKELKAAEAADQGKLEALKAERKDAFQSYSGKEGQLAQDQAGTTLQVAKEVEKVADKASLRDESDKDTVDTLMVWVKELKDEKKVAADNSQGRVNTVLRLVELREKAVEEFLATKAKDKWTEAQKAVQALIKEQEYAFFPLLFSFFVGSF